MPEGGTLTIGSAVNAHHQLVEIRVEDTGHGISKDVLPHIFDLFFTTNVEGKGLGLGLSPVYGMIDRHKGTVTVESKFEKGAVFTIKLPLGRRKGDWMKAGP